MGGRGGFNDAEFFGSEGVGFGGFGGGSDERAHEGLVGLFDSFFATVLVDEVDKVVGAVKRDLFVKVKFSSIDGGADIADFKARAVVEVVDFVPEDGDAASCLHV